LDGRDILWQILAGSGEIPGSPTRRYIFDAPCLPEGPELRTGHSHPTDVAVFVQDDEFDHAVGAQVGIRIHQQSVDDAEDGGGGADAQGERNDGGQRQAGLLAQLPECEQEVLQRVFDTVQ
jgi:hypothetical protein